MKICSKCKQEIPLTNEYYHRNKNSKDGFQSWCKKCNSIQNKKYYKENIDEISEIRNQYYNDNKEKIKIKQMEYQNKNKDKIKEYQRDYQKKYSKVNKISISEYQKQYYIKNKNHLSKYKAQWIKDNPEKEKMIQLRRKTRIRQLPHYFTNEDWEYTKKYFNNSCAYCGITEYEHTIKTGQVLHQEHFIPVIKEGGYVRQNIIPACRDCNASKAEKDFFNWYHKQEYYDKKRERLILEYLSNNNIKTDVI